MNWDRIQSNWHNYKNHVKETFTKLTDQDMNAIEGRRDQLLGKLQERYGYSRDVADQKLTDFASRMGTMGTKTDTGTMPGGPKKREKV